MGYEKEKIKQIRGLILFVAVILLLVIYSGSVWAGIGMMFSIASPFITGGAIAFVLNLPLRAIENKILKKWNGKVAKKIKRPISMALSIVFIVAIIWFVIKTVVPTMQDTFVILGEQIPIFAKDVVESLEKMAVDNPELMKWVEDLQDIQIDWKSLMSSVGGFLSAGMGSVLTSAVSVAGNIIGGVVNVFISFIFAIYILSQKEKLGNQANRIMAAFLPEKVCNTTKDVLHRLNKNFGSFISGQCLEAVILGCLFAIFMSIFRFPYVLLISVLIAFTSLIPVVGAFIGCAVGAFLILMGDPLQALWFIILFLIIQQIEGNLIYPYVVGNSVGLPSIWVLAAVTIGGSLFGVLGMLCFIPLVSTGYSLLRDSVNARNKKKAEAVKCCEEDEKPEDTQCLKENEPVMENTHTAQNKEQEE